MAKPPRASKPSCPGMVRGKGPMSTAGPKVNHGSTPAASPVSKVSHSKPGKDAMGMNKGDTYSGPKGQKSIETQKALVKGGLANPKDF